MWNRKYMGNHSKKPQIWLCGLKTRNYCNVYSNAAINQTQPLELNMINNLMKIQKKHRRHRSVEELDREDSKRIKTS